AALPRAPGGPVSAREAPLHRLHAAGIGAAGDDAEIGARLPERLLIDVGLGGSILNSRSMIYIQFSRRGLARCSGRQALVPRGLPMSAGGSASVIRRCRLDVRFAQKRTRLGVL